MRPSIRSVLVLGIVLVLVLILLSILIAPNIQRAQELAALGPLFSKPRAALPANLNVDTIFPQQVGTFKRIGRSDPSFYGDSALSHVEVSYANKPDNTGVSIIFDAFPHDPVPYLKTSCANESISSHNYQRVDSAVPYSYSTCATGPLSPFEFITGVAWGNGNWEFKVKADDVQTLIEFLKRYPY